MTDDMFTNAIIDLPGDEVVAINGPISRARIYSTVEPGGESGSSRPRNATRDATCTGWPSCWNGCLAVPPT